MQEPNSQRPAMASSLLQHDSKGNTVTARTPYPHTQPTSNKNKGFFGRLIAFISRMFFPRTRQQIIATHNPRAKVVFRSTTSTFITPVGCYAGSTTAPELQRIVAIEQFRQNHHVPQGTTIN